jgi:xanthine dehydrogenase YagT iron-sulfur-binding subunit
MKKQIRLRVNGLNYDVMVKPRQTLLDALRDELGLVGTKKGYNKGE